MSGRRFSLCARLRSLTSYLLDHAALWCAKHLDFVSSVLFPSAFAVLYGILLAYKEPQFETDRASCPPELIAL